MKDFLYIENEKVKASVAILQIKEFRAFYTYVCNDRTDAKVALFNDYITFIYYVYKLSSQFGSDDFSYYNNKSLEEREVYVVENELEGRYDIKHLRKDKTLFGLIKAYNEFCKPGTEILRDNLYEDMNSIIRDMANIPNTITETVFYDIPEDQRKPGMPYQVQKKVNIPNIKAKTEAYKNAEMLLTLKEKYDKLVFKEKTSQQKGQSKKYQFEDETLSFNLADLNKFGDLAAVDISGIKSIYGSEPAIKPLT